MANTVNPLILHVGFLLFLYCYSRLKIPKISGRGGANLGSLAFSATLLVTIYTLMGYASLLAGSLTFCLQTGIKPEVSTSQEGTGWC